MPPDPAVARLFPHHDLDAVLSPRPTAFALGRLLEDGSSEDLRELFAAIGEPQASAWLAARGGRALTRRSRAFWEVVLATCAAAPPALARDLWPLA